MNETPANDRLLNIVVFGIERKGLAPPAKTLEGNGYRLIFEQFDTPRRLHEFDGAIVPQGIFESFERRDAFAKSRASTVALNENLSTKRTLIASDQATMKAFRRY